MSTARDMRDALTALAESDRQRERIFGHQCRQMIDRFCHEMRHGGYITHHEIRTAAVGISTLHLFYGDRQLEQFTITDDELRMGGVDGLREWLERVVRRGVRRMYDDRPVAAQHFMGIDVTLTAENFRRAMEILQRGERGWTKEDEKAAQKAKDLFRAVAGQRAFEVLEAGNGWPVQGSAGGQYELLKRASFCIRRVKDGAELCAVVPGVPLYDHLLGVKLMIEHDEVRFIKTANVAAAMDFRPGGITWVDPVDLERRRSMFTEEAMRAVNPPLII